MCFLPLNKCHFFVILSDDQHRCQNIVLKLKRNKTRAHQLQRPENWVFFLVENEQNSASGEHD